MSMVRLIKVPPYYVDIASENSFHAGSARSDGDMESMNAASNVRYHVHFVKNG